MDPRPKKQDSWPPIQCLNRTRCHHRRNRRTRGTMLQRVHRAGESIEPGSTVGLGLALHHRTARTA